MLIQETTGAATSAIQPKHIAVNLTALELLGNCGTNSTDYDTCKIMGCHAIVTHDWRTGYHC